MVGGRVMVDGGVCNPVPFDLVADEDILIAVDVAAEPSGGPPRLPRGFESLFGSVSLLMRALVQAQTEVRRVPDIMVRPPTAAFNILDFTKAAAIIGAAEPMKDDIKRQLDAAMRSLPARR
jgi:NTE family protein